MAGELAFPNLMRLGTTAFSDILVVSAFGADDPIRHMIPAALDASASRWRDKLSIRSVAVASDAAFCDTLNAYLRMQLLTDLLRPYLAERILSWNHYQHVHTHGNAAINYRRTDWFEFVAGLTAERSTLSQDQVNADFRSRITSSDTIRYLQLGNPETILIGDPSILQHVEADLEQAE